jgi:DNA-binding phage protein
MKDPPRDNAMAEIFREDPAYAGDLLNSILEDGDPGELLIALRQMTQAFDGAAKDAVARPRDPRAYCPRCEWMSRYFL